ncbi:MAG: DUF3306 domain-containing protein [Gammaproteobacteria bacterium]|nr:DUF3306 domain-containing protein [Gammaproteobacteria bacterium]
MSNTPGKETPGDIATDIDAEENDAFLTRWSKRKALSREGVELPEPAEDEASTGETGTKSAAGNSGDAQAEIAAPVDGAVADATETTPELPPIESLGEDSDYRAFLADNVPADVQRKALRKLFRSPKFNVRDGLDDYDLDFTSPEPLGDIVTAEMRHRLRQEFERLVGLDHGDDSPQDETAVAAVEADAGDIEEEPADSEPDDEQPATA